MKTQLYTILGLLIYVTAPLNGQQAIDFTFTDTNSSEHTLYADYLDQGKVVLIDWFFVACPPCNSYAPTIQEIYEDWGEGQDDVEFFTLSNKSFDSNDDVKGYEDMHGLTNPGAGEDGGSVDAFWAYHNSEFGPIFSTPHFTVIAPNGTVFPDVDAYDTLSREEAINEAITLALTMTDPIEIDTMMIDTTVIDPEPVVDTFVYNILLQDTRGNAVADVVYTLRSADGSGPSYPITIQPDGTFTIVDLESSYPDLIDPIITFDKTGGYLEGVFSSDIILILRHLLGIQPFSEPYQFIAGDVNNDGNVSAADMSVIRKNILEQLDGFPSGVSWKFIPSQINLDTDTPGEIEVNVQAIKIGDVNRH